MLPHEGLQTGVGKPLGRPGTPSGGPTPAGGPGGEVADDAPAATSAMVTTTLAKNVFVRVTGTS